MFGCKEFGCLAVHAERKGEVCSRAFKEKQKEGREAGLRWALKMGEAKASKILVLFSNWGVRCRTLACARRHVRRTRGGPGEHQRSPPPSWLGSRVPLILSKPAVPPLGCGRPAAGPSGTTALQMTTFPSVFAGYQPPSRQSATAAVETNDHPPPTHPTTRELLRPLRRPYERRRIPSSSCTRSHLPKISYRLVLSRVVSAPGAKAAPPGPAHLDLISSFLGDEEEGWSKEGKKALVPLVFLALSLVPSVFLGKAG